MNRNKSRLKRRVAYPVKGAVRQKPVSPKSRRWSISKNQVHSLMVWLGKTFLLVGIVSSGYFLWPVVNQPVSKVELTGDIQRLDRSLLKQRVEETISSGLLMLDIDALDTNIEKIDWVYSAEIRKKWPNRLMIEIEEERPIARWGTQGYLAASGTMVSSTQFDDLASLPGFDVQVASPREALDLFHGLNAAMSVNGISINGLSQSQFGSWSMVMDSGSEVVLGKEDLMVRIQRVMNAWPRLASGETNRLETVDARYPNGLSVKYQNSVLTTANPA